MRTPDIPLNGRQVNQRRRVIAPGVMGVTPSSPTRHRQMSGRSDPAPRTARATIRIAFRVVVTIAKNAGEPISIIGNRMLGEMPVGSRKEKMTST
jgi:hypothetical protein